MDGWTRLWVVVSGACVVSAAAVGQAAVDFPGRLVGEFTNPAAEAELFSQMDDPACAKFRNMREGDYFNPLGDGLPMSANVVSALDSSQCGRLIAYRNTTTYGRGPADSREQFLRDAEQFRARHESALREYRVTVYGLPLAAFVASWLLFFSLRPVVRWVRAGFAKS
jgi:hypothetical protein